MKLNDNNKAFLSKIGYTEEEFPQIEYAMRKGRTLYYVDDAPVSREEAIQIVGRENYLSGIARSAFHGSSLRFSESQEQSIYFDSSQVFDAS